MKRLLSLPLLLFPILLFAQENQQQDLPPATQVKAILEQHVNVMTARSGVKLEQANQRKWNSGNYEFNVRAGSAQRTINATGQAQRDWDVAIERPLRLPNKVFIDGDIGDASVSHAEFVLGDARHEAARLLLHLWFNWQREQAQASQWQQQVEILEQQSLNTDKRMRAGDAPRMELNQALAAVAQARVSLQQAVTRAQLAAADLKRPFPELVLPESAIFAIPQGVEHDLAYWREMVLSDNHELGMAQSENRVQQLLAKRNRADRVPDPTVGLRYSNEKDGEEKVAGIYVSVPISFGLRGANAEIASQHAEMSRQRELALRRRLEGDIYAAHTRAVSNFAIWQQSQQAAKSMRDNAELMARAYKLGESSLSDVLNARRFSLESSLADTLAQLDANEARYRLLLDAHQLWQLEDQ